MPVLRSAVNGLAIGILSGTRGVIPFYRVGENNKQLWGHTRDLATAKLDEAPVPIQASITNPEPVIDPIPQPKVEKVVEEIQPQPKKKGRSKPAPISKAKVVNDDPKISEEEAVKQDIQDILDEKGIV